MKDAPMPLRIISPPGIGLPARFQEMTCQPTQTRVISLQT